MKRNEIIAGLKVYFAISDLVCPHVHLKFGDRAWMFLSTIFLHTLLVIRRDILKAPMICNNYHARGIYDERGLRCNLCSLVRDKTMEGQVYLSAHITGQAGDFEVVGMSAKQARYLIMDNILQLSYPIRLEDSVTWLHVDTYDTEKDQPFTLFTA